jgi:pimeloyl-ACP methyl ester carboxylesterase
MIITGSAFYRGVSTRFDMKCYPDSGDDYVILLHGIAGFSHSMKPLAKELHRQGYTVINVNYPSTLYDIPTIAETFLDSVVTTRCIDPERKIHFVTHSMGSIVTRYYIKSHREEINLGRVVMLSPPNSGSEIVDTFKTNIAAKSIFGPALNQLSTESNSFVNTLGPVDYDVGIIMGNKAYYLPGSLILPGKDDGIVAIQSAPVEGMKDFEIISDNHTNIMTNKKVIKEVICFLKEGNFRLCGNEESKSRLFERITVSLRRHK